MPTKDPRIDAYIAKSAEFARPILKKLRALVHRGCPDVKETVKWGMPSFEYKGKTDETRQRRMTTAVEWIAQGKSRNWKYEKC